MKKEHIFLSGVVSGVAVWAITRALERFETKPEAAELHSRVMANIKNTTQFHRADEAQAGTL